MKTFTEEHRKNLGKSLKGRIPWNKGKTGIYSEETLKKMSEVAKERTGEKNPFFNKTHSDETKRKIGEAGKGKIPWNKGKTGVYSKETIKNIRDSVILTIEKIKELHPFFTIIEEMRYNPDKPEEKEIQVHCKNHECANSKEKEGWFTPKRSELSERMRQLEKDYGNDGAYFYCSEECKNICPLYHLRSDPYKKNEKPYTDEEYQTFRLHVLERDNYKCQFCGIKATDVHHERSQKLEPFFALDPDFAWSCCEKCHYEKGHQGECSTGKLASKVC